VVAYQSPVADGVGKDAGWPLYLQRYATLVDNGAQ
jgi:hypothetical protein